MEHMMAKNTAPEPEFQTGRTTLTAKEPEDRYAAEVAWIIEQDAHLTADEREQGIHNTVTVQVPSKPTLRKRTDKETGVQSTVETDTIARYKRYIQQSAHRQDRTADIIRTEEQGDDTALLTFLLKPAVKRPRKANLDIAAENARMAAESNDIEARQPDAA